MKPVVSIIGFQKEYSHQMGNLIVNKGIASGVNSFERVEGSQTNLHGTDLAIINGYDNNIPLTLRSCVREFGCKPPACLIIGNKPQSTYSAPMERRRAPRLHLANAEISTRILLQSLDKLLSSEPPAPEQQDEATHTTAPTFSLENTGRIGKYQLVKLLGKGGMGEVYEATSGENSCIALKLVDTENLSDFRLLDRFLKEYEILSSVNHPNIIQVYDQGFTDSHLYIAMKKLSSHTLKSKIKHGLKTEQALDIAMNICHALATIHELGILHRDIKPNNILFDNDLPVITDFGISKMLNARADMELTMQGEAVGTPAYMSPEQALSNKVTTQSDLYAFGVLLYQMFSGGKLPFPSRSPLKVMQDHVSTLPPHLPAELQSIDHIVQQLLSKQPEERQATAWVLHEQLKKLQ